jgi:hypothetical protein
MSIQIYVIWSPMSNSIGCGLHLIKRRSLVRIPPSPSLVWTCQYIYIYIYMCVCVLKNVCYILEVYNYMLQIITTLNNLYYMLYHITIYVIPHKYTNINIST